MSSGRVFTVKYGTGVLTAERVLRLTVLMRQKTICISAHVAAVSIITVVSANIRGFEVVYEEKENK